MEKKYKIHEVAEYLGLTPAAIRHYEQKGLISVKKDPENGYRMYSDEDIYKLWTVAYHRSVDMSIDTINTLKHCHTLAEIRASVEEHREHNCQIMEEAMQNIRFCEIYDRYLQRAGRLGAKPMVKENMTLYFYPREESYRRKGSSFPGCTLGSIFNEDGETKYSVVYGEDISLLAEEDQRGYLRKEETGSIVSVVVVSEDFFYTDDLPALGLAFAKEAGYDVCYPYYSIYLVTLNYFGKPQRYYEILLTLKKS